MPNCLPWRRRRRIDWALTSLCRVVDWTWRGGCSWPFVRNFIDIIECPFQMLNGLLSLPLLVAFSSWLPNPLTHDSNLFLAGHANGWRGSESHLMCVLIQGVGCLFPVGTLANLRTRWIYFCYLLSNYLFFRFTHIYSPTCSRWGWRGRWAVIFFYAHNHSLVQLQWHSTGWYYM